MPEFALRLTKIAEAFADAKYGGVAAVERRVREALAQEGVDVGRPFRAVIFMTEPHDMEGDWLLAGQDPRNEYGVVVDTGTFTDHGRLGAGPFEGKAFFFPEPDSDWDNQ